MPSSKEKQELLNLIIRSCETWNSDRTSRDEANEEQAVALARNLLQLLEINQEKIFPQYKCSSNQKVDLAIEEGLDNEGNKYVGIIGTIEEQLVKNTRTQATILRSYEKTEEEHKNTRLVNFSGNSFKASCVHFICTACQEHKNTSHNLAFI